MEITANNMRITADIIKDIFYRMYFFLPKESDEEPFYKTVFTEFWQKYGIKVVEVEIGYWTAERTVVKSYNGTVAEVDVLFKLEYSGEAIKGSGDNLKKESGEEVVSIEIKETKEQFYFEFNDIIKNYYDKLSPDKDNKYRDKVNKYWKEHSAELFFLIRMQNKIRNPRIKEETQKKLSDFNDNALRFINELIQNADDCSYLESVNTLEMTFDVMDKKVEISYPETGFTYADIISLSSVDETNKMIDFDKATSTIGEKGRGFKSIFVYFKEVEIESGGYHFKYNIDERSMFEPIHCGEGKNIGTKLVLRLNDNLDIENLINDIKKFYGDSSPEKLYRNNSIFFTKNFTELRLIFKEKDTSDIIQIKNTHRIEKENTYRIEERNESWWVMSDTESSDTEFFQFCTGSMQYATVSGVENEYLDNDEFLDKLLVNYKFKLNLVGLVKYINYTKKEVSERYGEVNANQIKNIKKKMPIIIFGIKDGNNIESSKFSGHMYTYLPTSLNIRLPFIFQIPFDLVDNRSCPKSNDNSWNKFLLEFIWDSEKSVIKEWYEFVKKNKLVGCIYDYLPTDDNTYSELAYYNKEEYKFDTAKGEHYAAIAGHQIKDFNEANGKLAKELFKSIAIFENCDTEGLKSIENLKILDETLVAFDIERENLFWEAYQKKNEEKVRFIYSKEK